MPYPETSAPRRRGRPVSVASRDAVLHAAADLLDDRGLAGFNVDEVARRSRVSKSTIYKHWPGGLHIAVEAYGTRITEAIPLEFTGDPVADLIGQVRRIAEIYASPQGRVIAQLLGAGAAVDGGAEIVREGFFAQRRNASRQLIQQGLEAGLWQADFDPDAIIELLFGPIVFRALNGGEPFSADTAAALAAVTLRGLTAKASDSDGPTSDLNGPAMDGYCDVRLLMEGCLSAPKLRTAPAPLPECSHPRAGLPQRARGSDGPRLGSRGHDRTRRQRGRRLAARRPGSRDDLSACRPERGRSDRGDEFVGVFCPGE